MASQGPRHTARKQRMLEGRHHDGACSAEDTVARQTRCRIRYNRNERKGERMPNSGIKIGRIFGIPIYLHSSWFIIFALITYSLATQFASEHEQWSQAQHWAVGVLTSLLFFGSVLFHELAHSVVAQRYKIPVVSITLFVFGGVALED